MLRIWKLDGVPEAFFVGVGEEELPGLAGVGGFVEAGEVSFAGGHDDGGVLVEGLDAAEVEFFGVGWGGAALPCRAFVGGAEDGALGSAGPRDSVADVVDAAEAGGGVGVLDLPLGVSGGGEEGRSEDNPGAHERKDSRQHYDKRLHPLRGT